ncbi:MAG TPA: Lpg1974 family pore-forming outer membrane protein [Fimbriiglobus sp.]|nr:Lpg1974 family pore-forming outer membrane protein [Fimbriiglobus sp.]
MSRLLRYVSLAVTLGAVASTATAQEPGSHVGVVVPVGDGPLATPEPPIHVRDLTPAELPGGSNSAYNVLTTPESPGAWLVTADYLLWRPRLDSTDYALLDPRNDLAPQGRVRNLTYDTRSGLRVGLGYRLPGHGWDVGVTYTDLHTSGHDALAAPPGGVLYPTLTRPGLIDTASRAAATAGLDYQVFDIDFGKRFAVDPYLSLRVFGGVRLASIDVDQSVLYDGCQARLAEVRTCAGLEGAGPTAGAEARWAVSDRLGLFGTARGGMLFADFDGRVRETNAGGAVLNADVSDRFAGLAPFVSVGLGGSWRWRTLTLVAGYEVTHWFKATTRPVLVDDFAAGKVVRRRGDLSLDGIFLRLGAAY